MNVPNTEIRKKVIEMVYHSKDGHIPSSFSIVEILKVLYEKFLKFDPKNPRWSDRDYFILSKGHGCVAFYVILEKLGFITAHDLEMFCHAGGILGEHPDCKQVPGIEASTGSLGHGFPFAVGIALGLRLQGMKNKICVLVGDGECHEGTIWEAANVANNLQLGNLCVIVDWNGSAAKLMPKDDLPGKWRAFGWQAQVVDGHSENEILAALKNVHFQLEGVPNVIVAKTTKGKGIPMIEGHGIWHHKIPNQEEFQKMMEALS